MAKVTWLGEDTANVLGPPFVTWRGLRFDKGKAVEVNDEETLAKARNNKFFKVDDGKKEEKEEGSARIATAHGKSHGRTAKHSDDEDE